jgi:hypothetical protein
MNINSARPTARRRNCFMRHVLYGRQSAAAAAVAAGWRLGSAGRNGPRMSCARDPASL